MKGCTCNIICSNNYISGDKKSLQLMVQLICVSICLNTISMRMVKAIQNKLEGFRDC
jgi:hypothetical protein